METIFACASGERTQAAQSCPVSVMSSTYDARPVMSRGSSLRRSARPTWPLPVVACSTALLAENPDPTEDEIRHGLEGNLCRCTGYQNIVKAVQAAAAAGGAR